MSDETTGYEIGEALDPAASVFVSANAGAGKTSLLANRVLRLLLHGAPPARILCLTFTNAAAAEMESRVLKELGAWVMAEGGDLQTALEALGFPSDAKAQARARSLFARVLEAPGGMRIQTLHGFCQTLLRRFPIEAGVSPHFTVMDGRTEQELLRESRLRLFNRAQTEDPQLQESISAIARDAGEFSFHALVSEVIQFKRRFRALLNQPGGVEAAIERARQWLDIPHAGTARRLLDSIFIYSDAEISQWKETINCLRRGEEKEQRTGEILEKWFSDASAREKNAGDYVAVFLTQKGAPRNTICKKNTLPDATLMELLKAEQERAWRFCEGGKALDILRHTSDMLYVAEALLTLYDALKWAHVLMDYDDLILHACALLKKPGIAPWVLFKLDGGIDHILVDEAQDTSPEQWTIIEALTQEFFAGHGRSDRERSLFVVGDEKQSIYSFQGADPAALARMRNYFSARVRAAALPLHHIALTRSFRSAPEILSAVDAVFARGPAREGLMAHEDILSHTPTRGEAPGLVEIWPVTAPASEEGAYVLSPAAQLARHIADTIRDWLRDGVILEAKGRAVRAGDIMILVRNRTGLVDKLVRALKRRDVPVAGQDRMRLGDNLAVQDLVALGQCLLLPEDDLTLAALLKSPIFNISEEELFALAWNRGKESLWQRLGTSAHSEAYALLVDLRAKADFAAPYELYSYLLETRGARQRFTGRMGEEYSEPMDEFLGQALLYERGHAASLQGFLHWLNSSDSEIKRDMEQTKNAVRIMTVHGAKGLQAPIVIMPDTVELPKMKDALLWQEKGTGLPFWPVSSKCHEARCAGLYAAQKQAMMAEYRRLLYVAMTRAEDRLYIYGATGKNKVSEECWHSLIYSGIEPVAQKFDIPGAGIGLRLGRLPSFSQETGPSPAAEGAGASPNAAGDFFFLSRPAPAEPDPPQPLAPSRLSGEDPPSASPLLSAQLYQRGTLIHKMLQYLPGMARGQRNAAAQSLAAGCGEDMFRECLREAEAVMDNPEFAFLFGEGGMAEVPVAGCLEIKGARIAISGQIDRLYVGEKEIWIVDFKSNRVPRDPVPSAYLRQMALYRALLQRIYPEKTVRCALLWTAVPAIVPIAEALLDEVPASSYI